MFEIATDEELVKNAVLEAIRIGYRHIDTAFGYKNENAIGDALQTAFRSGLVKREDMFITTKLPGIMNSLEKIKETLGKSLASLQLPSVDLYLIHFPWESHDYKNSDSNTKEGDKAKNDLLETWKCMENMVDEGLTKAIGLSNFNSAQIKEICNAARIKPANVQVECNLYFQQEKLFTFCKDLGITFTAYAPIGSPGLAAVAKARGREMPSIPKLTEDPLVVNLSKKYRKTSAQICLRFLVERGIIVIPKSVTPERIKENFDIFDFHLTQDEINKLKQQDRNLRLFSFRQATTHPNYPFHDLF